MRAVDQPNWRPLETLADTAAGTMLLSPDDFMRMGRVQTTSGVEVELYKLYGINHHVNVDHAGRASRYEPGNGLVCGGCDAVAARGPVPRLDVRANEVFARHNRAGRLAGRLCPPLSIGNVVRFGEVADSAEGMASRGVEVDPGEMVVDRS